MTIQEQRLVCGEVAERTGPAPARSKPISLYEFGSHEKVVRRIQRPFAKYFQNASPVLDIGCGRGIFLEILTGAGISVVGLDHSDEAVGYCQRKGFEVHQEDARSYLARTKQQFGGIFCSHVIEHLAYDDAMDLIALCHAALRPGGVLLLVTPNPLDIAVISEIFWLDPTHVRPYPTELLKSMVENAGMRVALTRHFLGDWHLIGRRHLVGYCLRKLLLGRYYGKPNALVLARKNGNSD
jgi:2-polyprenyl-3-methyl-5-hydroxy-6-metoxy-1,4-benzoquinol methylase